MKRILALLLAAVLCLSLVACGGNAANNGNANGADVATPYIVRIKINPEIELVCDAAGVILSMTCLNDDAKTATNGLNVVGSTLDNGLTELLLACHQTDYLTEERDRVSIAINRFIDVDNDSAFSDMCNIAMQNFSNTAGFLPDCDLTAGSNMSDEEMNRENGLPPADVPPVEGVATPEERPAAEPPPESTPESATESESEDSTESKPDSSTESKPGSNPNTTPTPGTFTPSPAPTPISAPVHSSRPEPQPDSDPTQAPGVSVNVNRDENGAVLWEEARAADGTLLRRTEYMPDGTAYTTHYYLSGVKRMITAVNAVQTRVEYFYENGMTKWKTEKTADHRYQIEKNSSGVLIYQISISSDGSFHEEAYYDSGLPKRIADVSKAHNTFYEKIYHANGNLTYESWRQNPDDYGEKKYYDNGKLSYVCDYLAASNNSYAYLEEFYDESGNLTEQRWKHILHGYGYAVRQWRAATGIAEGYTYKNDGTVWYEVRRGNNWETQYQVK